MVVLVKKLIQQSAVLDAADSPLRGRRNVLVAVASQLGAMPPWLYHENPLLALVQVGRPRAEERAKLIPQAGGGN